MQTDNPVLDSMARIFTNAAGAAQAFRTEVETIMKGKLERLVADLDLVPREDFDAVKAMAAKARAENAKLAARVAALEAAAEGGAPRGAQRKPEPTSPAKSPRPRRKKS